MSVYLRVVDEQDLRPGRKKESRGAGFHEFAVKEAAAGREHDLGCSPRHRRSLLGPASVFLVATEYHSPRDEVLRDRLVDPVSVHACAHVVAIASQVNKGREVSGACTKRATKIVSLEGERHTYPSICRSRPSTFGRGRR